MVIAGNETTRNTITGGLMALTDNPAERQKLIDNPSLIANATDEMLRWVTSVIYCRRTATRDTSVIGQDIKKGDKFVIWYGSANRDEDIFEDGHFFLLVMTNAKTQLAF